MKELPQHFIWSETLSVLFKIELNSQNIQDLVNEFLNQEFEKTYRGINAAASKVEYILYSAAKNSLKRKNAKRRFRITKHINKKWFDKDCRLKRHQVRKLANLKHKDPLNESIRYEFHNVLKEYRNLLKNKQHTCKNEKLTELSNTDIHLQTFWKTFKTLPETETETPSPPIDQSEWLRHFGKLHSVPNTEHSLQQSILNELQNMGNSKAKLNTLDYPVTFQEVRKTVKKLKNKKAASSDLIKNEMLKASYEILMNVYIKLFNLVLDTGIYPSFWCDGLITPIFKTGDKSDPGNYRGICVSSCLGKLFSSILNHRLLDFAANKNLLHSSQIGF